MVRDYIKAHPNSLTCLALVERLDPDKDIQYFKMLDEGLTKTYPALEFTKSFHERVLELSKLAIGSQAPEINLNNPEGVAVPLSSLKGKVVLIDFWASWCRPCRAENPNVVRLYKQYQPKGFEVYSVSLDRAKDAWVEAIAKDGLLWKNHVSDLGYWQSSVVKQYNISGIPMTYLIDKDGKIIGKGLRGEELEKKLSEMFN
jgi:thiol-disulfide isomerase/thioredoxin